MRAAVMAAQAELAGYMEKEPARLNPHKDKTESARAQLRAVGTGYLKFAQAEPGLFRLAFSEHADLNNAANPASTGSSGFTPFQILSSALDALVSGGILCLVRCAWVGRIDDRWPVAGAGKETGRGHRAALD